MPFIYCFLVLVLFLLVINQILSLYSNPLIHILIFHSIVYEDLLTQILILLNSLLHFSYSFLYFLIFLLQNLILFQMYSFQICLKNILLYFGLYFLCNLIFLLISLKIVVSFVIIRLSSSKALSNSKLFLIVL